jgi:hypothetical protein
LLLGDRAHIPGFPIKRNAGRGDDLVMTWNQGPFNLSGNDAAGDPTETLSIWIASSVDGFTNWSLLALTLPNGTAETTFDLVSSLNGNQSFSGWFTASNNDDRLFIRQKKNVGDFRFYIQNGGAEEVLGFNARSGVGEITTYFDRDRVFNQLTPEERTRHALLGDRPGSNCLVKLDPSNAVDAAVINNATDGKGNPLGYDSTVVQPDWKIMDGKSAIFQFTKYSSATVASTEEEIVYPAGAQTGDLALKIIREFDASPELVNKYEVPYTLLSSDLITPP